MTLENEVYRSIFNFFQNIVMSHIKSNGIRKFNNMVANVLLADPLPYLTLGVKRSKIFFLEHGHVAYQIKGNHECRNIVANILPPPPPQGMGSIGQKTTFSEHGHFAYQIKRNHEMKQHGRNMVEIVQVSVFLLNR